MRNSVACVLIALMTGCATVPMADPAADASTKMFAKPSHGQAAIYLVRESHYVGGGVLIFTLLDGQRIGSMAPGTYRRLDLSAGNHVLTAVFANDETNFPVELPDGDVRFIKVDLDMKGMRLVARPVFEQLSRDAGIGATANCRLASSK